MTNPIFTPPIAPRIPHTFTHLGQTFTDHYAWLHDKSNPEVIAYLEAENAYAHATLQHTESLQAQLFAEMKGRIKEDDHSAPERRGGYFYYWRMQAGQQYRVFCRKHGSLTAPEEVLLDENALAEGLAYCRIASFEPSPDHSLLAYSVDTTGALVYDLYIKDLRTGQLLGAPLRNTAWSIAWANDNRTLFYTLFDAAHRPYQLMRYTVGAPADAAQLVYHEPDEAYRVFIDKTRSGAYLLLTLSSHSTSEVHYLSADEPCGAFQVIHPRQHWLEYYVEHHGDRFLIRTNDDAENFKLMAAPVATPSKSHWQMLVPHRPDTYLEEINAFQDHLLLHERHDGLQRIRISAPDGVSALHYVEFPDPVYAIWHVANHEFATTEARFSYSSLVTPTATIDYDMQTRAWQVKKQQEIPSGYDQACYTSERLHARAPDGALVPLSLVYRKDLRRDGNQPLLLAGYGAYGYSWDPDFDTMRLSLLDRGFAFAIAHIRGGSELGRAWYEQGRLMQKKNSFHDFIACAEQLITQGYTSPEKLAITGTSAGGLLVSAVANLRPELCKAVVARVPFTNVINAALMPELPLTIVEYEQWGHPDDPHAFAYMQSYSPYDNVEAKTYPHIFAKAGLNDLQVPYWDPAKWVAKLRAHKTDPHRLLLVTNMEAGHGGASGRYDYLREYAQIYAFLIDTIG